MKKMRPITCEQASVSRGRRQSRHRRAAVKAHLDDVGNLEDGERNFDGLGVVADSHDAAQDLNDDALRNFGDGSATCTPSSCSLSTHHDVERHKDKGDEADEDKTESVRDRGGVLHQLADSAEEHCECR